ncbi:MAG: hypothetical protein AAFV72_24715 [Cyanobacteria bacterium J06635_1]
MSISRILLGDAATFSRKVACVKKIGVNGAISIQQLHYWMDINQRDPVKRETHFIGGRWWVHNTYDQWQEHDFPFWSMSTLKRVFSALEAEGFVLAEKFGKSKGNQTKWYTLNYEAIDEAITLDFPDSANLNQSRSAQVDTILNSSDRPIDSVNLSQSFKGSKITYRDHTETTYTPLSPNGKPSVCVPDSENCNRDPVEVTDEVIAPPDQPDSEDRKIQVEQNQGERSAASIENSSRFSSVAQFERRFVKSGSDPERPWILGRRSARRLSYDDGFFEFCRQTIAGQPRFEGRTPPDGEVEKWLNVGNYDSPRGHERLTDLQIDWDEYQKRKQGRSVLKVLQGAGPIYDRPDLVERDVVASPAPSDLWERLAEMKARQRVAGEES